MDGWMGSVVDDVIFFGLVGSWCVFFFGGEDDCEVSFVLSFPPFFEKWCVFGTSSIIFGLVNLP